MTYKTQPHEPEQLVECDGGFECKERLIWLPALEREPSSGAMFTRAGWLEVDGKHYCPAHRAPIDKRLLEQLIERALGADHERQRKARADRTRRLVAACGLTLALAWGVLALVMALAR